MGKSRLLYSMATCNSLAHSFEIAHSGLRTKMTELVCSIPLRISSSHLEEEGMSSQSTQILSDVYPLSLRALRNFSTNALSRREYEMKTSVTFVCLHMHRIRYTCVPADIA